MSEPSLHFTLLENGLDFLWSAIEHLDTASTKRALKYATLHLVSGIELILKERLRREDWRLLFRNPTSADRKRYESGNFRSVGLEDCLDRLETECDIRLGPGVDRLNAIKDKRNRFEHLALTDSPDAIIVLAAQALEVVVDFIRDHLADVDLAPDEQGLLERIRAKLSELEAFVTARQQSLGAKLKAAYAVLTCPACLQETLTVDDGVKCLFCGYVSDGEKAADAYATHVMGISQFRHEKDGGVWPVLFCPSCDWQTCVDTGERGHLCFGCGEKWPLGELDKCGRCERLIRKDDSICNVCLHEVSSKDD